MTPLSVVTRQAIRGHKHNQDVHTQSRNAKTIETHKHTIRTHTQSGHAHTINRDTPATIHTRTHNQSRHTSNHTHTHRFNESTPSAKHTSATLIARLIDAPGSQPDSSAQASEGVPRIPAAVYARTAEERRPQEVWEWPNHSQCARGAREGGGGEMGRDGEDRLPHASRGLRRAHTHARTHTSMHTHTHTHSHTHTYA